MAHRRATGQRCRGLDGSRRPLWSVSGYWFGSLIAALIGCGRQEAQPTAARLRYVTTVEQFGPVSYRDPFAVISPDGMWLGIARARHIEVQRATGGPVIALDTIGSHKSDVEWLPDSRHLAVLETAATSDSSRWVIYDIVTRSPMPLWPDRPSLNATAVDSTRTTHSEVSLTVATGRLRYLKWSANGHAVAAVVNSATGAQLWTATATGDSARVQVAAMPLAWPVWVPGATRLLCVLTTPVGPRVSDPCGAPPDPSWQQDVYGPLALSPDASTLYYAAPDSHGTLDLWSRRLAGGQAQQLTHFTRDTYAPSIANDGSVLFKLQEYAVSVAMTQATGGPSRAVSTFMSETPSWDATGKQLGVTYGNWRRVVDDANYPDIAQDVGIIRLDGPLPATAPDAVVQASPAEDQGFAWSPNGRWIAFHSHQQNSDDIWLEPADRSAPPREISARGEETGWPRWSRDGRWIAYPSHIENAGSEASVLYVIAVDQQTGGTQPQRAVPLEHPEGELVHAEWLPDGDHLAVEMGDPASPAKALYVVNRQTGHMRLVLRFRSEQLESGIGIAPDGRAIAYVAPAPDGHTQIFIVPTTGGEPRQLTHDPSNKTQPAWSPDGREIAFTVWRYRAHVFALDAQHR